MACLGRVWSSGVGGLLGVAGSCPRDRCRLEEPVGCPQAVAPAGERASRVGLGRRIR